MSTLGWQILKKVREEGEFCYTNELDIGRICKRTIPYTGVDVSENVILQLEQTFLKNYDAIRAYDVGKHKHPGDRQTYMTIIDIVTIMLTITYLARVQQLIRNGALNVLI